MNEMKKVILTMVVAALATSGMAQSDCGELLDANQDGLIGVEDLMNLLSHFGDSDFDFDGVFDSVDDCVGEYDECGVCNGAGIPEGYCDCGVIIDALGICGGDCAEDYDNDGVCDQFMGPCLGQTEFFYEGYNYNLIEINNRCWFAENLRSPTLSNGDTIQDELSQSEWNALTTPGRTTYGYGDTWVYSGSNDVESNLENYGQLYNGYAVITEQVCPIDFHVPSIQEWEELFEENLLTHLKASPEDTPSWNGTNESGMSLAAGGYRGSSGYAGESVNTRFWTGNGTNRFTITETSYYLDSRPSYYGCYIRCIKDSE